jgi:hypothetical protein
MGVPVEQDGRSARFILRWAAARGRAKSAAGAGARPRPAAGEKARREDSRGGEKKENNFLRATAQRVYKNDQRHGFSSKLRPLLTPRGGDPMAKRKKAAKKKAAKKRAKKTRKKTAKKRKKTAKKKAKKKKAKRKTAKKKRR